MTIKFTKTFEINENGNCRSCKNHCVTYKCEDWEDIPTMTCKLFDEELSYYSSECRQLWITEQCQECKDFLEEDKLWNAKLPDRV